jgi:DDE superfamily endonuclease
LANLKPSTYQELFNLRHSSLRNVIERIFGILKRRFKCLNTPIEYPFDTQVQIVFALTGVHNWIRMHESRDMFDDAE